MKKFFALLALVLGVVSCQTEGFDVNVGGEQDVNITVSLPEGTRANSALGAFGGNVNFDLYDVRFQCEVHYNDQVKVLPVQISDNGTTATFPVRLIANRNYTFVVWADLVLEDSTDDLHYNTENGLTNITLNDTWVAMDETRDAFTCAEVCTFERGTSIDLKLTRPFAKLRVVTTDMEELMGIKPTWAKVEYATPYYTSFNAYDQKPYDLSLSGKTHSELFDIVSYDESGASKTLFTDYFFAINPEAGQAPETVAFTMEVFDENGATIDEPKVFNTSIPVKRNYVTTIKGNILTYADDFTVTIDDAFENADDKIDDAPYYQVAVTNGADLLKAIAEGREIIALNHIIVTEADKNFEEAVATRSNSSAKNPVLNLNGFKVTFVNDNTDEPLITVAEGSSLTIVDEEGTGAIVLKGDGTAIVNNGTLNIEGGSVDVSNGNGTVIVNNGEANIEGATLNEGAVENNGTTNVNGGEVADGAIENSENAIVGTYVYNAEELEVAINACVAGLNNEVSFGADIEGDVTAIQKQGVKITINGRGFKYNGSIKVHSNSNYYADAALTIKNVNFETATDSINCIEALENGSQRYSNNITVEKCTFTATDAAINTSVAVQVKATRGVTVKNCTANNMHSLIQAQSCNTGDVKVENCTVNGKNGVAFKQVKSAVVEGTTITALEYGIRYDGNIDNYGIVVKNNDVTAYQPLIVRKMTGKNNTIALESNTFKTDEPYHIVITKNSDDEAYVAPTGTYTLTGAENYMVFPREQVVTDQDELIVALNQNANVIFAKDIKIEPASQSNAYGTTGLNVKKGNSIYGNGYTLNIKGAGGTWDSGICTTGGLIKDLKVTGSFRGIFVKDGDHTEKVVLENVTLEGVTYTISVDQANGQGIEATNCTFNGWTSYAKTIGEAKFTNCSFGEGSGYKFCRPYAPTTFVDCNFCEGYAIDARDVVKFENCTFNGVAVTAENLATLVTGNIQNAKIPSTVSTADELIAALEDGRDVVFANDIKIEPASMSNAYGATGINIKNGQTINGNGYTLNIKGAGGTWDSGINTTGGVIKNLTVTGSFRGIFINHTSDHSEKVVLENVTIGGNGTVYTISCDQGLYQGIEATNCTFNGWTSFAKTAGEAKFVNCNFGEGSTYKYCRPYSNTEFVGCTFCPGYAVDTTRATVTFTDCTWEE